jgi:hypothetical protein
MGTRNTPELLITDFTTDKEIVISALADTIYETYMKEVTQQSSRTGLVVETTPGYLAAVRQACFIDVTVTGNTFFMSQ